MSLPWFYEPDAKEGNHTLSADSAKHAVHVLRMRAGDKMMLTNGLGLLQEAIIVDINKKNCMVQAQTPIPIARVGRKVGLAVSPLKNTGRFEWLLEKVTEMGVTDIIPLQSQRTIPGHFRYDRMNGICISAMLQSQQAWLPVLHPPFSLKQWLEVSAAPAITLGYHQKWIAHCEPTDKHELSKVLQPAMTDSLILIGPEGDFTPEEITLATGKGYQPVGLGHTRLRTETAAIAACTLLCLR
jgi:16S rRNA (uracil1498-N3)-methyltransferase